MSMSSLTLSLFVLLIVSLLFGLFLVVVYFQFSNTSLILAAESGHRECVSLLLKAGASVDIVNKVTSSLSLH